MHLHAAVPSLEGSENRTYLKILNCSCVILKLDIKTIVAVAMKQPNTSSTTTYNI